MDAPGRLDTPAAPRLRAASHHARPVQQRGAIAVMAAIMLPVLLGFAALVFDLGRLYVVRAEIRSAMEGCALAGVTALDGSPNSIAVAQARAMVTLDPSRVSAGGSRDTRTVNRLQFQNESFVLADVAIEFAVDPSGPWQQMGQPGLTPAARYVRCRYVDRDNPLFLVPVLEIVSPGVVDKMDVAAMATAGLRPSQSTCALPMAVCTNANGTRANGYGLTVGARLQAISNPSAGYGTGNFGWIDFTGRAGGASNLAAMMSGSGACSVAAGTSVGQQGVITALNDIWNTRFGLYGPNTSSANQPPDFSGYSYPSGGGHYATHVSQNSGKPYQSSRIPNNVSALDAQQLGAVGRNRRLAAAPIVDCTVWNSGNGSANPAIQDFACVFLLSPTKTGPANQWDANASDTMDLEYLGLAGAAGAPCTTLGLAGGGFGPPVPTLIQ